MSSSTRNSILPSIGLLLGCGVAYIDTRPTWDDTGITAGVLLLGAAALSAVRPNGSWLIGLAVGFPVLAMNVVLRANYGAALAVVVAVVGASIGAWLGRLMHTDTDRVGA
jgi:hypothetical protein